MGVLDAPALGILAAQKGYLALPDRFPKDSYFTAGENGAGIERDASGVYKLFQRMGDEHYFTVTLDTPSGLPGAHLVHQITDMSVRVPCFSKDDLDVSGTGGTIVFTGTWTNSVNSGYYSGGAKQSSTTGDKMTYTTPDYCVRAVLRAASQGSTGNGGYGLVKIDSDATRATCLLTAQDYVDNGLLVSTALVANGGTLNPTDRLIDFGAGSIGDLAVGLADDLPPAVHTVEISVTGYKRATASAARVYIGGLGYGLATTKLADTDPALSAGSRGDLLAVAWMCKPAQALDYEYAYYLTPTGGTTATFVGNVHGYETEDSFSVAVDGQPVTLSASQRATGSQVVVTRVTRLHHPDIGAGVTDIATVTTTYTMDRRGLRIRHVDTHLMGGTAAGTGGATYPAMLGVDGSWLRGMTDSSPSPLTLTTNDDGYKIRSRASTAYIWQKNGPYAVALHIPDPQTSLNGWANAAPTTSTAPGFMSIQDRTGGAAHKIYAVRDVAAVAYSAGDVWTSEACYMAGRLPRGAEAVMSI